MTDITVNKIWGIAGICLILLLLTFAGVQISLPTELRGGVYTRLIQIESHHNEGMYLIYSNLSKKINNLSQDLKEKDEILQAMMNGLVKIATDKSK